MSESYIQKNKFMRWWQQTINPDWYHGYKHRLPFFEGWYYKLIDSTQQHKFAIIPGVFLSNDPHAFIQILNGTTNTSTYHRYPIKQFKAASNRFDVRIGGSRFRPNEISLDIDQADQKVYGTLQFPDQKPWPVTVTSPGIMGWYAWVPTMECYHGVISLDHSINGSLSIDEQTIDFTGGRGYIEKDWGKSFPSAWIWMQTNHFETQGVSLTASTAMIPWQFTRFRGFIVGLLVDNEIYRFATYTGAKTEKLTVDDHTVEWILSGRTRGSRHRLYLRATRAESILIAGPSTVDMGKRVAESLTAEIEVRLTIIRSDGEEEIFSETGYSAGLEVYNTSEELLAAEE